MITLISLHHKHFITFQQDIKHFFLHLNKVIVGYHPRCIIKFIFIIIYYNYTQQIYIL